MSIAEDQAADSDSFRLDDLRRPSTERDASIQNSPQKESAARRIGSWAIVEQQNKRIAARPARHPSSGSRTIPLRDPRDPWNALPGADAAFLPLHTISSRESRDKHRRESYNEGHQAYISPQSMEADLNNLLRPGALARHSTTQSGRPSCEPRSGSPGMRDYQSLDIPEAERRRRRDPEPSPRDRRGPQSSRMSGDTEDSSFCGAWC